MSTLLSKMFDVGDSDLLVLTFGNWVACKTTRTFLCFLTFFSKSKNTTFYVFWVVAHVFSNTGFWYKKQLALYLAGRNEFRFFSFNKYSFFIFWLLAFAVRKKLPLAENDGFARLRGVASWLVHLCILLLLVSIVVEITAFKLAMVDFPTCAFGKPHIISFLARDSIYMYAIARYMPSPVRLSGRLSVRHTGGSVKDGSR